MKILGIDYGRKKVGLAFAATMLAEVYGVIRFRSIGEAIKKIKNIVDKEEIEKVVIGISEGEMAKETKKFGEKLEMDLKIPIVYQDETLSTKEAQRLSIEAGIGRKKRQKMEDAYSATLILQEYLFRN